MASGWEPRHSAQHSAQVIPGSIPEPGGNFFAAYAQIPDGGGQNGVAAYPLTFFIVVEILNKKQIENDSQ